MRFRLAVSRPEYGDRTSSPTIDKSDDDDPNDSRACRACRGRFADGLLLSTAEGAAAVVLPVAAAAAVLGSTAATGIEIGKS